MSAAARRLRVLVVALGRRGGTTQYGQLMTRGLAQHCDVATILASAAENAAGWAEIQGSHLAVRTFSSVPTMLLSYLNVACFARIRRFARDFAPDVIYYPHGHGWKWVLDLLLPRDAATVLTIHDPRLHRGEDSLAHRLFDASNRLRVDGYVLLNESQRREFVSAMGIPTAKTTVIPHGIFDDLLEARRPLGEVESLAQAAAWSCRYLLFVGRIQRYKGLETLLRAYCRLAPTSRAPLVIAGDGQFSAEESAALRELGDAVPLVVNRWLSETEIASLVAAARFVVLPYTSATQSGVIPLASAFGVPAIASDTGGLAEQVVDGETGLLFPAGDATALAETLERAFGMDDAAYGRMSRQCNAYARENWAWDCLAERLLEFSVSLIAGRPARR